jgi:hypothetical protein
LPLSDAPADVDLREQLARIDLAIAETARLQNDMLKFVTEQRKAVAEQQTPAAEAASPQGARTLPLSQLILRSPAVAGLLTAPFVRLKGWFG